MSDKPDCVCISMPEKVREQAFETGTVQTYAYVRRGGRGAIVRASVSLELHQDMRKALQMPAEK